MEQLASIFSSEIVQKKKCSRVVLLNGSVASNTVSTKSSYVARELAEFFSADGYIMPVPLIVDNQETAELIRHDSHISYVFDYAREARIAVFSIGDTSLESVLRTRGAYTDEDYDIVLSKGAVGNILGHCYKFSGMPVTSSIGGRIIGLSLEELKKKEYRIGIGIGVKKAKAIIGALRSRIINHLYTDSDTAKEVLRIVRNVK
jgi:deoxyribonucleoside regulator